MMYLAKQKINGKLTGQGYLREAANHKELIDELHAHGVEGEFDIMDDSEFTEDDIDAILEQSTRNLADVNYGVGIAYFENY